MDDGLVPQLREIGSGIGRNDLFKSIILFSFLCFEKLLLTGVLM
ncbi:MAG: hypothetical protein QXW93_03245 [Desulfurococcaceae archaeon]